jgi:histidyl-tRNA synthetase
MSIKLPKGTRDFTPNDMILREYIFKNIISIFKKHGGLEIDTPVFELTSILKSKYNDNIENNEKLIFEITDNGGDLLALRYDLTVPFARFCASNNITNIKKYQIGKVYRRENPSINQGRYREFFQCDFDITGNYPIMIPDAEILKILTEILDIFNLNYTIKINHRKILSFILNLANIPDNKFNTVCSSIDKLDKESWENIEDELLKKEITPESISIIKKYILKKGNCFDLLNQLKYDPTFNELNQNLFNEINLLFTYLQTFDIIHKFSFDLTLARGLDYYTGIIYEATIIDNNVSIGSIAAGGRYDNLIGLFSNKNIPSVGLSIGFERIFYLLQKQNMNISISNISVLVVSISENLILERMKIVNQLWKNNISAEFVYSDKPNMKKQIEYAINNNIPIMIIIGPDEAIQNKCIIKNIINKEQNLINQIDIVSYIKNILI